ncbi:heme-degrading monooxygenase HmoA [Paenibacillus sacheonensis]|nr:heme-degrading monooxygenase HmoA [Paenibacillus sacheonensis]
MGGEQAVEVVNYLKSLLGSGESGDQAMIVVENRIEVKAGFAEAVMERFKAPKSVHTFQGFVRMDVLHAATSEGTEEVRVCTTWEKEEDFHAWANSDSFRHAHARREAAQGGEHGRTHGEGGGEAPKDAANGPIVGNKVTVYKLVASHLPEKTTVQAER